MVYSREEQSLSCEVRLIIHIAIDSVSLWLWFLAQLAKNQASLIFIYKALFDNAVLHCTDYDYYDCSLDKFNVTRNNGLNLRKTCGGWLSGLLLSFRSADVKIQSHQEHNYLSKIWVVLATQLYLYRLLIPCLLRQVRTRNDDGSKKKDIYMCTHHSATYFFSSF